MLRYVFHRGLRSIPQLLLISVVAFVIIELPVGDFVSLYFDRLRRSGMDISEQVEQRFRALWGLDRPLPVRYLYWLRNVVLRANFGYSFLYMRPVSDVILDRIPLTFALSLGSLLFTWAVGIPLGTLAAVRQYSIADYVLTTLSYIGMAVPPFLLALILMYVLRVKVGIDVVGLFSPEYQVQSWSWAKFANLIAHLWLPIVLISMTGLTGTIRTLRATMLDEMHKPYVTTARAKGLRERAVVWRYLMRLAISPIISDFNRLLPWLFSGSLLVAMVLSLPTAGLTFVTALFMQDLYLAGTYILITGTLTSIGSLLSDVLLAALDPRIRLGAHY
jgi:peptide/nickel transport system permease protein